MQCSDETDKMNKMIIFSRMLLYLLGVSLFTLNSEAAITGWIVPTINGAADGAGSASPKFPENLTPGNVTGVKLNATSGEMNKTISYVLISQPVQGMFAINQLTGAITFVGGVLDFEKTPTYLIRVRATDTANAKGIANVTLQLSNTPPTFSSKTYNSPMCDGAKAGTTSATVKAVDPGKTNVTYTISTGNTNSDFAIDGKTGVITVAATKTLNMTATKAYTLVVEATDTATPQNGTGTATVSVVMKVCNSGASPIAVAVTALLLALLVKLV